MNEIITTAWIAIAIGSLTLTALMRPRNFLVTLAINLFVCFIIFNMAVGSGIFDQLNLSTVNISGFTGMTLPADNHKIELENVSFQNFTQPIVANMTTKFKTGEDYFGSVFK